MIGLTNYIESVVINSLLAVGNKFQLFEPTDPDSEAIDTPRLIAAKSNITLSSHDAFLGAELLPIDDNQELGRNLSLIFIAKSITENLDDPRCLAPRIAEIRLQNAGAHGEFPIILPSREKSFR
jgi:hypothetical protein